MLQSVLQTILLQSVVGSMLIVILQMLKLLTRKVLSAKWHYYIWLIVLLSMVMPVSVGLRAAPINDLFLPHAQVEGNSLINTTGQVTEQSFMTKIINNTHLEYRNIGIETMAAVEIIDIAAFIWIAGVIMFLLSHIISYIIFIHKAKRNSYMVNDCREMNKYRHSMKIHRNIALCVSDTVTVPLLVGIFRPAILLPNANMTSENLSFVLQHELTHYKRKDLVYKWFAMFSNALHWFNPLIYLVIKNINEDCEVSCDISVTKNMNDENKDNYMKAVLSLLSYSSSRKQALTTAMANEKGQIKRRFTMIRGTKRSGKIISMLSIILAILIVAITIFTNSVFAGMTKDEPKYRTQNEVYYKDSMEFSVNISGKSVPDWVGDIAGQDGKVDITLNPVKIRDSRGWVNDDIILELKGTKGKAKLSSISSGLSYGPSSGVYKNKKLNDVPIEYSIDFCEFNNVGYPEYRKSRVAELVSPNSGQKRYITINLAYTKELEISFASVDFDISDQNDNITEDSFNKYDFIEAGSINFTRNRNIEKDLLLQAESITSIRLFTDFERDFENKKVYGIDCSVASASADGIVLKTDIKLDTLVYYDIFVINDQGTEVLWDNAKVKQGKWPESIVLAPENSLKLTEETSAYRNFEVTDAPERKFTSGKSYRIDIGFSNADGNIVYRQREYAAIP